MVAIRKSLWIGALVFGVAFLALGIFFVAKGFEAKGIITTALAEENVTTSADAVKFGVPAGLPVRDARTAQAQADTIKLHSTAIKGEVLKSGTPTTLYYADMKSALFVSPEAYAAARSTYVTGLTLRGALGLAVMGYGLADLAIGAGAVIGLMGLMTVALGVPALYWAKEAEGEVVREVSHRLTPAPLIGGGSR